MRLGSAIIATGPEGRPDVFPFPSGSSSFQMLAL